MRQTRSRNLAKASRTDWSRATHRMPASFADQPRRDSPVEGRRNDDGLELVEALAGAAALAAIAELAAGDALVDGTAVQLGDEDVVATQSEEPAESLDDDPDEED